LLAVRILFVTGNHAKKLCFPWALALQIVLVSKFEVRS
jgi:hypothetical protein